MSLISLAIMWPLSLVLTLYIAIALTYRDWNIRRGLDRWINKIAEEQFEKTIRNTFGDEAWEEHFAKR